MPRFAILEHDWPTRHWDLLLESGGVLRAWRLLEEPGPDRAVAAEPNFDHRVFYLDYEGPLTGNRGIVTRWDSGTFDLLADEPELVEVNLKGTRLIGVFRIAKEFARIARA
jgi:hypothetical protein